MEDVSGVDSSHVLIGCIASVLVVLNFSYCFLLLEKKIEKLIKKYIFGPSFGPEVVFGSFFGPGNGLPWWAEEGRW